MYYLTILDFSSGTVHQIDLTDVPNVASYQTEDFEWHIDALGFKLNDIEWMSHTDNTLYTK